MKTKRKVNKKDTQRNVFFQSDDYKIGRVLGLFPKFLNVGKQESDVAYNYKEHVQDEYEFIYILKGSVEYKCNDEKFVVEADDMYLIQPGQKHKETSLSEPLAFIYVKFFLYNYRGVRMDSFLKETALQKFKKPGRGLREKFIKIFDEMQYQELGFKQIVENRISEILIDVMRLLKITQSEKESKSSVNNIIELIIEDIATNVHKQYSVEEVARAYGLSKSSLHHVFKKQTGLPFKDYVNRVKIKEAEYQLTVTDKTVTHIAWSLGFSNVYYFCRLFKKYKGITPTEFRNRR
ncbi:MAG: AraC family transcriptional regulator [Clostridia bacterium]|nr:AraC family transcriptional regulator [Clostridia bacterium]